MLFEQITIVGVGLIGGSVGLAAKARGLSGRVVGIRRGAGSMEDALQIGAVDAFENTLAEGVRNSGLVVVCTPVDHIAEVVIAAADHGQPGLVITDVGSTKAEIVASIEGELPSRIEFVGSHPLAGSERSGVRHARADLFENRVVVVTRTEQTNVTAVDRIDGFWRALGARVVQMTPEEHDRALAVTSHLPHAAASALAAVTPTGWLHLAAGGFRDATRIAAGEPRLWAAIFQENCSEVRAALEKYRERIDQLLSILGTGSREELEQWLSEGKQVRDALGS